MLNRVVCGLIIIFGQGFLMYKSRDAFRKELEHRQKRLYFIFNNHNSCCNRFRSINTTLTRTDGVGYWTKVQIARHSL
jgi:hypothetical protein